MKQQRSSRFAAFMTALLAAFTLMSCGKDAVRTEPSEISAHTEEQTRSETETAVTALTEQDSTAAESTSPTAAAATTTTTVTTGTTVTTTTAAATTTTTSAGTTLPRTTATQKQTTVPRTTTTQKQTTAARTTTTKKQTTTARTTTTKKQTTTSRTTTSTTATAASAGPTEASVYQAMLAMQKVLPEGAPNTNADYYAWKGGIFRGGYGCAAFAFRLSDAAFGDLPARKYNDYTQLRVGDLLRVLNDTHFVVVLEIRANELVLAEGNYDGRVHWFRTMPLSEVFSGETAYAITRYPAQ